MKDPDPLDKLLSDIGDIMGSLHEKRAKPIEELPDDIQEQLKILEASVKFFCKTNEEIVKSTGITPNEINERINSSKSQQLNSKNQRIIQRAGNLKKEAKDEIVKLKAELATIKEEDTPANATGKKDKAERDQERKKKKMVKKLGGHKGWIPL